MNLNAQTQLAKLLAKENITVQHGNFRTAFFDVNERVLGLPIWKDRGKDVYDLLVGHEVGHALYTPADGWHGATTELEVPRSYVNIVEDIRIERKIQTRYPGLVASFKRGYKVLFDENFFGTSDRPMESYGLMDRINIKAKLRDLVDVPFSAEEQPYVDMAFKAETFEDVIEACKALYNFIKDNVEDKTDSNEPEEDNGEVATDALSGGMGNDDETENTSEMDQPDSEAEDSSPSNKTSSSQSREEDKGDEGEEEQPILSHNPEGGITGSEEIETDTAFRENSGKLLENENGHRSYAVVRDFTQAQLKEMIASHADVLAARNEERALEREACFTFTSELEMEFKKFFNETKKITAVMAKEFEMRKAAYQYSRSQSARSGSIDVNRLADYKFSDDIFNRVTQLADAKSHGMVMVVDYSGSMGPQLLEVVKQTLTLSMFCKKVGIPFEVYAFTSSNSDKSYDLIPDNGIDHRNTQIWTQLTSFMKKGSYDSEFKRMFIRAATGGHYFDNDIENMGGTPLYETLIALNSIVDNFKAKTGVQKTHLVILTDGDGHSLYTTGSKYDKDFGHGTNAWNKYLLQIGSKTIKIDGRGDIAPRLYEHLKTKANVIGFYIASSNSEFNRVVARSYSGFCPNKIFNEYKTSYRKNKFAVMNNVYGHDQLFVLKSGKSLDTDTDDFDVEDDASKGRIATAFKKYSKSKKGNRVLATEFAKMVA